MEKNFIDERGEESKVVIESGNDFQINMSGGSYKLANEMRPRKRTGRKGIFTSNIGPGSNGFAGIATLAIIVALAGIIIAFIVLRV